MPLPSVALAVGSTGSAGPPLLEPPSALAAGATVGLPLEA
jgi:hypothetical protein